MVPPVVDIGQGAKISVYYDEGLSQLNEAGLAIVQRVVDEVNKRLTGRQDVITLEATGLRAQRFSMFDFCCRGLSR